MLWEYFKACIYGIIEGITEWLPISSTGHLILLERIVALEASEELRSTFDVVIQLGAVLAVLFIYIKELWPLGKKRKAALSLWGRLIIATIPAALIGLAADAICERLFGKDLDGLLFTPQVVASALIVYGILFIIVERLTRNTSTRQEITPKTAFAIGCFQALSIVPGTSRSGATILGARILGVDRESAARFSFFAAIPVIAAASLLKMFDLVTAVSQAPETFGAEALLLLLVGSAVAFGVSLITLRFLTDFVKKHSFIPFGIYRIILGVAVLIFIK